MRKVQMTVTLNQGISVTNMTGGQMIQDAKNS